MYIYCTLQPKKPLCTGCHYAYVQPLITSHTESTEQYLYQLPSWHLKGTIGIVHSLKQVVKEPVGKRHKQKVDASLRILAGLPCEQRLKAGTQRY